ncbi:hypothetical protein RIF29_00324 [Crotalaria pallida]|uniref:Uncharacterized protein n=1 Tax=Crotalaria pallida TaxID=3830 RepID=A0AAN9IVN4_CROPI
MSLTLEATSLLSSTSKPIFLNTTTTKRKFLPQQELENLETTNHEEARRTNLKTSTNIEHHSLQDLTPPLKRKEKKVRNIFHGFETCSSPDDDAFFMNRTNPLAHSLTRTLSPGQMNLIIPNLPQQPLSFSKSLSQCHFLFHTTTTTTTNLTKPTTIIRMGGGPRTFPGGVSKWQWKRMQAKKAKQLLKARLSRERQIYEMRKRAELKAAVSELERPWEVIDRPPNLFSIGADEQVKVLADRFQRPGGFDMWSDKDGPQLFETPDELPSARFFPKGVVHSVKPYRKVSADDVELDGDDEDADGNNGLSFGGELSTMRNGRKLLTKGAADDGEFSSPLNYGRDEVNVDGGLRKNEDRRWFLSKDEDDGFDDGDRFSSPINYGRNGDGRMSKSGYGRNAVKVDDRLRKNGNERRFVNDRSNYGERSSSPLNYGRNGTNVDGRVRKNGNERRFLSNGVSARSGSAGERSSPLSYERNEMSGDDRMRRNGNGRRFMSEGVDDSNGDFSSRLNYGRNGDNVDGRMRKNENGRRFMAEDFDGSNEEFSSPMNYGRNGVNVNGRMRNNGNGRRFLSKDIDGPGGEFSSPSSYGRNGVNVNGRMRQNGNGSRFMSRDVNWSGGPDGERSSPLKYRRNGVSGDGRMRRDENRRGFVPKDVGGSNELNPRRVGYGRDQRGSNSIQGKRYSRGTSGYASRRARNADSEVYDMGLQQDGSYGFQQNGEQSDSENC